MPSRSIDIKVTLDDEQYRQRMSELKAVTKLFKSELDVTTASFKGQEDSIAAMSAKMTGLSKVIEATTQRLQVEEQAIAQQKGNIETTQRLIQEWTDKMSMSKKAIESLSSAQIHNANDVASLSAKYKESGERLDLARKALSDLNEKYTGSERNFPWFKKRLGEAIDEVERAKKAHEEDGKQLAAARKEYDQTARAIEEYKKDVNTAQSEIDTFTKKQADAEKFLRQHQTRYNQINKELVTYQTELKRLEQAIADCTAEDVDSLEALKKKRDELEKINKALEEEKQLAEVAASAFLVESLKKYADTIKECVDAYMELETAMIGVSKTNDMTETELKELQEDFKALSTTIPVSASELAKIAELGGQLGISADGLEKFAVTIANMSVSTNLDIEEASTAMAQFANIVGMSEEQYERLGSAIVGLGNNFATDEKTIVLMAQRFASAGVSADISAHSIAALAAAAGSLGFRADAGASGMTKLIETVKDAVSTGDGLEDFASLAGMTGREFATAFGEDAAGAIALFLNGLGNTGAQMDVLARQLGFGDLRVKRLVTSMAAAEASSGLVTRALEEANTAWEQNIALQTEADKFNASLANHMEMLANACDNLKATIGEQLAPTAEGTIQIAKFGVEAVNELITIFPDLVTVVNLAAVTFGYFALKALPMTFSSLNQLKNNIINVATGAFTQLETAIDGAIAGFGALSTASKLFFGAAGAIIVATIALMKHGQEEANKLKESMLEGYEEEFKGITTAAEAARKYNEVQAERQKIIDELIAEGRQASFEEQARIDAYTEAMERLESMRTNMNEQFVEDAQKRLASLSEETSAYESLASSIYANAAAEDYLMDKKNTDYELTYQTIKDNLESQKKWIADYSSNFESLINRDIDGIEEWALSWADGSDEAAEKLNVLKDLTDEQIEELIRLEQESKEGFLQIGNDAAALRESLDSQEVFQGLVEDAQIAVNDIHLLLNSLNGIDIKPHFTAGNMYIAGHAQGLNYVPYDDYPAMLHEGEMVLNRAEARMYRAMETAPSTTNNTSNVTLNVYGAQGQSVQELANVVMTKIQQATDRRSAVWA